MTESTFVDMEQREQVEAYRGRLALVDEAHKLTAECMNSVIAFFNTDGDGELTIGTLTGWRFYQGIGLFGPQLRIEVTICTECVGREARDCVDRGPFNLYAVHPIALFRNEDNVRSLAEVWGAE